MAKEVGLRLLSTARTPVGENRTDYLTEKLTFNPPPPPKPPEVSSFANLLRTETVAVRTHNLSFSIHQGLLKTKCPVLYGRLTEPEWEDKESEYLRIVTSNDVVSAFMQWIYTDTYPIEKETQDTDGTSTVTENEPDLGELTNLLVHHIRVYVFAGVYQIRPFQSLAYTHIGRIIDTFRWRAQDSTPFIVATRVALVSLPMVDPLVGLFLELIAIRIKDVRKEAGFSELVRHFPDFALRLIDLLEPFDVSSTW
ncbi:hypothetical protein BO78DRAFT_438903 [Aspergillus sclerotiicarbonarius CBS 121057]|uniref:BTB domain-containing protein n=1 Tax=Aspergillus sclerotiicarbonarius (strain CBS 121057 / IBT 28362) TaxID=1448318 RepID=A0A319EI77_ASPSB|nr:hypothetical protein BO78DRAFT_438903 [Aspergillus sclerotiicarbonarius CBS 121057]